MRRPTGRRPDLRSLRLLRAEGLMDTLTTAHRLSEHWASAIPAGRPSSSMTNRCTPWGSVDWSRGRRISLLDEPAEGVHPVPGAGGVPGRPRLAAARPPRCGTATHLSHADGPPPSGCLRKAHRLPFAVPHGSPQRLRRASMIRALRTRARGALDADGTVTLQRLPRKSTRGLDIVRAVGVTGLSYNRGNDRRGNRPPPSELVPRGRTGWRDAHGPRMQAA